MKRSELKPNPDRLTPDQLARNSTFAKPIARQVAWQARTPIKAMSDRRKAAQPERRAFVKELLARFPGCQIGSPICTKAATQVHEAIKRSQGGAIVPGPLATEQGQEFFTSCWACNCLWVEQNDHEARRLGFTKSNPIRGQKRYD